MTYKFTKGYSERGASMGRQSYNKPPNKAGLVRLFRVDLDSGGYDNGGAYWGIGPPLWCAMAPEDETGEAQYRDFTRASNRKEAMELLGLEPRQLYSLRGIK